MKQPDRILKHTLVARISICLIGTIICLTSLFGQTRSTDTDSIKTLYPKKRKNHSAWEHILSFPGTVLNLPFKCLFTGLGATVGYVTETKIIDKTYDFLTSDDSLRALRPTYTSQGGAGIRIYQKNLINEGSRLELTAAAGLRSRQSYAIGFEGLRLFRRATVDIHAGYRLLPDESFYGIGPKTDADDRSNYAHEQTAVGFYLGASINRRLDLDVRFSLEQNNIFGGKNLTLPSIDEAFPSDAIPGLETRVKLAGGMLDLTYDTRNIPGRPTSGGKIGIGAGAYKQLNGETYGFWRIRVGIKRYIRLFYDRTLILRLAGEMNEPLENRNVPFYYMSELGRRESIRGFHRGRFRDLDMILASVEYRYPIWRRQDTHLDACIFVDAGQVSSDIVKYYHVDDLQMGFGFGIKLSTPESESLQLIVSKSKEQFRVYLVLNSE